MITHILELGTISKEQNSLIGGKAKNLNQMIKAGFPIPKGFVITCDSYHHFLESCQLVGLIQETINQTDQNTLQSQFKTIEDAIHNSAIPLDLLTEINQEYRKLNSESVAVRSSAISEDSNQYSFAGQFETYLNITNEEELHEAIIKCWGSLWSNRALVYRSLNQKISESEPLAVVVQQMINSHISGVIFTQNPVSNQPNQFLIEASWGLGEAIVSGKTMTDSFIFDVASQSIIDQTINYKLNMCVFDADQGVATIKVPEEKRSLRTLSEEQIVELAQLAQQIRDLYQAEQDIEWAFDGEKFYILQSRPITTLESSQAVKEEQQYLNSQALYTCLDIGESFTGTFTPLGESFARYYVHNTHQGILKALGLRDIGNPKKYGFFLFGRAYLDVSYFAYLYAQCFLFRNQSKFLERFASEEVNVETYKNPHGLGSQGWAYFRSNCFYVKTLISDLLTYRKKSRNWLKNRPVVSENFQNLDLVNLSLYELGDKLKEAYQYYHNSCVLYGTPYIGAFAFYDVLKDISKQWFSKEDESIPELIKAGASELRTTDMIEAIEDLALEARKSSALKQLILKDSSPNIVKIIEQNPEAETFYRKYQLLLREHGVRAHQEMELIHPRWLDDPTYIFTTLKTYLQRDDYEILTTRANRNHQRIVLAKQTLKKLPLWKRKIYEFLMNCYLKLSQVREEMRMCFIQGIWMNRVIVMEVARRLVADHILQNLDEVAFITYDDILLYLSGKESAKNLFSRPKIAENRRRHLINQQIPTPPLTFIGYWDPATHLSQKLDDNCLVGVASSPGRVVGKARIILNLEEQMDEFEPGEILITCFTDTAWTPLFNLATAVVVDIGSLLSHSSIVARELGIPAVVNTKVATQVIRTGDTLVVDGNEGKVYLQSQSNP